jgi:hypothetical protein
MKINASPLLFLLFCLFYLSSLGQEIPEYTVRKITSELTIDGELNEMAWALADSTSSFVILAENPASPTTITWSKVLWDDENMYIAFYCEDANIKSTYNHRDDPLYLEDAVEVYIDPDGDGLNYLEIELNPLNTIFDLWLDKPWDQGGQGTSGWNMPGISTAVKVIGTLNNETGIDTAWTCEMAMPFAEMSFVAESMDYPPDIDDQWRFNLYRFDRFIPANPDFEATGWSQTGGGQHVPDKFGKIVFAGSDAPSSITESIKTWNDLVVEQNYPNPFNSLTQIKYAISKPELVQLKIVDMQGRLVYSQSEKHNEPGTYSFTVEANSIKPGVYFYSVQCGDYTSEVRKIIKRK